MKRVVLLGIATMIVLGFVSCNKTCTCEEYCEDNTTPMNVYTEHIGTFESCSNLGGSEVQFGDCIVVNVKCHK